MVNCSETRRGPSWLRLPTGLCLAAMLTVGSGLDVSVRYVSMQHSMSFAAVNAGGFGMCAALLWLLRALGMVHFRTPTHVTLAALLLPSSALVCAVLAAQQAIRYGNLVVHSFSQHLVPLLAVGIDYLASGAAPHSGELLGSMLTVLGATAMHFESHEMSFAVTPAAMAGALGRCVPAIVVLATALRVQRVYTLTALDIVFGCTCISGAMLLPLVVLLSPHGGRASHGEQWYAIFALLPLGLATMAHRVLQIACVLELGALASALAEEFGWVRQLVLALVASASSSPASSGDWKLWHGAIECGVMGSGIAVYLAARQVRLRCRKSSDSVSCTASEMDLECAGSSNANSKAGAPVRAAGWWRSGCVLCKRTLPSIGVMSAGLLLAAGPHVGHTLAPWRWPKQPTDWQLTGICGIGMVVAGVAASISSARGGSSGAQGRRQKRRVAIFLVCFMLVTVDAAVRVTVTACCIGPHNCALCSAGIVAPMAYDQPASPSSWWWVGMVAELGVQSLLAACIALGLDAPAS